MVFLRYSFGIPWIGKHISLLSRMNSRTVLLSGLQDADWLKPDEVHRSRYYVTAGVVVVAVAVVVVVVLVVIVLVIVAVVVMVVVMVAAAAAV